MSLLLGQLTKVYNVIINMKWINKNTKLVRRIRAMLFHNICREYRASFGHENPGKLIYIIRCSKEDLGFMGLYNHILYHIEKALDINAIPVIDCKHYPNDYLLEDYQVGKVNAWDLFFEQPTDVSLDEAYRSKNVIMSSKEGPASLSDIYNKERLKYDHEIIKKYMRLNHETLQMCNKQATMLGFDNKRVLGIKARGSDFIMAKPTGHSVCPSNQLLIKTIEECALKWDEYDLYFCATEDIHIYDALKAHFGDKLISNDTMRYEGVQGVWLNKLYSDGFFGNDVKHQSMLEYLIAIYLLSRCDALIGQVVGGTLAAIRMKGEFEHLYLFDLGCYE